MSARKRELDLERVGVSLAQLTALARSQAIRLEELAQMFATHLGHDLELAPVLVRTKLVEQGRSASTTKVDAGIDAWLPPREAQEPNGSDSEDEEHDELNGAAARAILNVLVALYPRAISRRELAHRAIYAPRSRHVTNVLGKMHKAKRFEYTDARELVATREGLQIHGAPSLLLKPAALVDAWRTSRKMSGGAAQILQIFSVARAKLSKREVSERSGYAMASRHFTNLCGELRTLEIIEGLKIMQLAPWFIESAS